MPNFARIEDLSKKERSRFKAINDPSLILFFAGGVGNVPIIPDDEDEMRQLIFYCHIF